MRTKLYTGLKQYWELIAVISFMTFVSGICHQTSVWEWIRFVGVQVFCLFIPGIAVMILFPMKNLRRIEKVLYSYAMGYIVTTVLYLFIMLTVGSGFLIGGFAVLAAVALAVVWRHVSTIGSEECTEEADDRIWIWTVLIVFAITLIVSSLRWRIPYTGQSNSYTVDYLEWVKKIGIFKSDGPAFASTLKNGSYHYLGMIQQAAVAKLADISILGIGAQYSYIESSVFLGLSSYVIVTRFIKNKKAQIITLVLILFSSGFENLSVTYYIWHIYLVPMSYHIAQSLGVMVILLMLIQMDEKFDLYKLLATVTLLICCTGTKGATGAVIFGGITLACMYSFFIQKRKKMALAYFICAFIGFGLVYVYLMSGAQIFSDKAYLTFEDAVPPDSVTAAETEGVAETTDESVVDEEILMVEAPQSFLSKGIKSTIGYLKRLIYINPWTILPMVLLMLWLIAHRNIKKEYLILFAMTMAGTILGYVVQFYGHSEMYFTLTVFPFAALLAGCFWDGIFSMGVSPRRQSVIMVLLCSVVVVFTALFDSDGNFVEYLKKGLDNLWIFQDNIVENHGRIVEYDEYCAFEWIRTHTQPDALILANDVSDVNQWNRVYCFIERDLTGFEDSLKEEDFQQYSEQGIDYILLDKYDVEFQCPSSKGKIVYENDRMLICELY